jgi:hypothetical protein
MKKRPTEPTANPEADAILRSVMSSPEFTEALKARAIAGRISSTEASLLRSLGVAVPVLDRDAEARENLGKMDRTTRRMLSDLDRLALSPNSTTLRLIETSEWIGVVAPRDLLIKSLLATRMSSPPPTTSPEPPTDDDADLMP